MDINSPKLIKTHKKTSAKGKIKTVYIHNDWCDSNGHCT